MPNRLLRDWTNSILIEKLSVGAERFFVRLIMKADDFGRYYADACLLRSFLYPRIIEKVKESEVSKFLNECRTVGLVTVYEVDSKFYLEIKDFGQRLRSMKSKFPPPPRKNDGHMSDACPPLAADGGGSQQIVSPEEEARRGREKREEEGEGAGGAAPPIPEEFVGIVIYDAEEEILKNPIVLDELSCAHGKTPEQGREILKKYHLHLAEKEQYPKSKKAVLAGFTKWLMNEKNFVKNGTHKSNPTGTQFSPSLASPGSFGKL